MGIIDPFLTNFTFGLQNHSGGKIVSELQVGLIKTWYCGPYQNSENVHLLGFKAGAEIKYLFYRKMFVAAQIFHNNYTESSDELVWRYNRVFTQEIEIEKHVTATGGHFKYGVFLHTNKRLFFEFYGGLGMRYRTIEILNYPEDGEPVEPVNFFEQESFNDNLTESRVYLSLALGFAIGFGLGK